MEALFLPFLLALTSALVAVAGARWLGLPPAAIAGAAGRAVEWVGFTVLLAAVDLAAGFALVFALRRATGTYVSLYLNADLTLLALSAVQAAVLQWWIESADGD